MVEPVTSRSRKPVIWQQYQQTQGELQRQEQLNSILKQRIEDLTQDLEQSKNQAQFSVERQRRLTAENERLVLLLGLTLDLMSLSPERVLATAVIKIPYILRAKSMSVYLYDDEHKTLVLKDTNHDREIDPVIDLRTTTSSLMALAVSTRQTLIVSDVAHYQSNQSEMDVRFPYREQYGTPSCMVSPLTFGDQVLGVINLADRLDGEAFDRADREALTHIAKFISVALANAHKVERLKTAASLDALTGLADQKAFIQVFDRLQREAEAGNTPLCMAVFDVTALGFINGNYGPNVGDMVLEQLATLVRSKLRATDIIGRMGGDLFAIAFDKTRLNQAMQVCRGLARSVAQFKFLSETHELKIDITLGLVQSSPQKQTLELIRDAEVALAEARKREQSVGVRT